MYNPANEDGSYEVVSVYTGEETTVVYDEDGIQHVEMNDTVEDWDVYIRGN
jgi:predicted GNAT family N-acyltransferase